MEMIAASRMRRAQQRVLAGRPYSAKMREVLADLSTQHGDADELHPLLRPRPQVNNVGVILITGDRGLAGGFNSNVIRMATRFILDEVSVPVRLITVGRKGRDFMVRYGREVVAEFSNLGDQPALLDTTSISHIVMDDYIAGTVDAVYVCYTDFVNTLRQQPTVFKLLPIEPPEGDGNRPTDYIYEPDPHTVLEELLPRYVEIQVYHAILESVASEYSARMVAMRNATDNADELIDDLSLTYNKVRQTGITKEVTEIATAANALMGT
jgi:F-type H+-transporting ATPase subunit gamma